MTSQTPISDAHETDVLELAKAEQNWLLVELVPRAKKPDKIDKRPLDPKRLRPVSKDAAAQLTFEEANAALKAAREQAHDPHHGGFCLGYLPREGSAMIGIDLDNCIDDDDKVLEWAREIIGDS